MARYIFITGGVVSSLGKGLMAASLGALLQARGYKVRIRKFDPYLNVDPGTMSPYQHGEVYVTDDGAETDLDLGHYERFTGVSARQSDNVTSGRIYQQIIAREGRGNSVLPAGLGGNRGERDRQHHERDREPLGRAGQEVGRAARAHQPGRAAADAEAAAFGALHQHHGDEPRGDDRLDHEEEDEEGHG